MNEEQLNARIRDIPLAERLEQSNRMIAKMCSERRPPKMTIPVQWDDEDYFICLTVKDAIAALAKPETPSLIKDRAEEHFAETGKWPGETK